MGVVSTCTILLYIGLNQYKVVPKDKNLADYMEQGSHARGVYLTQITDSKSEIRGRSKPES